MDTECIDHLLRSMSLGASRRSILTGLTGGFVAMLPLALSFDATEARKKKGKRKKKSKSKGQGSPGQTPITDPTPDSPPVNPCAGKPDFADCGNGMVCSGGVCAEHQQCFVGECFGLPMPCCSGVVCQGTCPLSEPGQKCSSSDDCVAGACIGFICQ